MCVSNILWNYGIGSKLMINCKSGFTEDFYLCEGLGNFVPATGLILLTCTGEHNNLHCMSASAVRAIMDRRRRDLVIHY